MAQFNIFVGRENELSKIDKIVNAKGIDNQLILIEGAGGVGKTFLLQKIAQKYRTEGHLVDYYDLAEQPIGNINEVRHLMKSFGEKSFQSLGKELEEFLHDIGDLSSYQKNEKRALNVCLQELNDLNGKLAGRKFIRLMDTFELSFLQQAEGGLLAFEKDIKNALFIVAGRDVIKRFPSNLKDNFGETNITEIPLKDFDEKEVAEFFGKLDESDQISEELRNKVNLLTNGRPVLLALSIEWLKQEIPLPEILSKKSLSDLQQLKMSKEWDALKNDFEFDVVDRVRSLKSPAEKAILYMAQVTKRFDREMLTILLGLQPDGAEKLSEEVTGLSFVRSNPANQICGLHDEMRRLVNRYVWPWIDPDGTSRRNLFEKVLQEYYDLHLRDVREQIKAIKNKPPSETKIIDRLTLSDKEWELWRLEAECLYYHLQRSENEGKAYFDDRYDNARQDNPIHIQFLLNELGVVISQDKKNREESENLKVPHEHEIESVVSRYKNLEITYKVKTAEQSFRTGKFDLAQGQAQELLNELNLSKDDEITVNNILGNVFARKKPQEAEYYFKKVLELAQEKGDKGIMGIIYNNLGQFYSNASRLDDAVAKYKEAIKISKEAENERVVASAMNNLAYTYRLQGNLERAKAQYRDAMPLRKKLGGERDLAWSYLIKAEIDRDEGSLEEAEHNSKLALQIFDELHNTEGQSRAYCYLGNICRYRRQFDEAERLLDDGIKLAEKNENIAKSEDTASLARLYHVYGQEQRSLALTFKSDKSKVEEVKLAFKRAEDCLEESQRYAEICQDQRLLAHNEHELTLVYFHSEKYPDEELLKRIDDVEKRAIEQKDGLLSGQLNELRCDIALRSKDYSSAARYIGLAAQQMGKYSGREVAHFVTRASEHISDLTLGRDALQILAKGILTMIKDINAKDISSLRYQCESLLES